MCRCERLELPQPDSHNGWILGVKLQAAVCFVAVPEADWLPSAVLVSPFLGRQDLHAHSRQPPRQVKTNTRITSSHKEFIWSELRHQRDAVRILITGRPSPVVLRVTIGNGRLPFPEIQLLLNSPDLLNGRLQFAFEVQLGDFPRSEERRVGKEWRSWWWWGY